MLINLTGHPITFVDNAGNELLVLEASPFYNRIRCNVEDIKRDNVEGIPIAEVTYKTNLTDEDLQEIKTLGAEGIIVSRITADALHNQGYDGKIYLTGRKFYKKGILQGVKELSIY